MPCRHTKPLLKKLKQSELHFPHLKIKTIKPFYNDKNYINLLSNKINDTIKKIDYDHILSYHGIPVSHLKISDPTKSHCYKVKIAVIKNLKLMNSAINIRYLKQQEVVKKLKIDPKKLAMLFNLDCK